MTDSIDSQLGGVESWARAAANQLAAAFGLSTVYGWRAGDTANPTTGHTAGLAVDFPVSPKIGDQLVAYVQDHAAALGVHYLIWQQRIWYPDRGWSEMAYQSGSRPGFDPNHARHVHISWKTTPPVTTGMLGANTASIVAATGAQTVANPFDALNPSTWGETIMTGALKLAGVAAGLTLVIMGVSGIVTPQVTKIAGQVLS
jgi:hypothetical protein